MNNAVKTTAALAALTLLGSAALAQAPTATPPPPKKPGFFSRMFHPKPKPGIYQSNGSAMHPMNGQPVPHGSFGTPGTRPGMTGNYGTRPGTMGGHSGMMGGQIIGNKNSHVYHMPGDGGSLPAPQNRVYFSSAAAAQAAGFHAAGGGHAMMHGNTMHGNTMPRGGAQVYH